jgi:hypothetical protein
VTAAHVAKQLNGHGYRRAMPLLGGLDAWNAHFRPGETEAAAAATEQQV